MNVVGYDTKFEASTVFTDGNLTIYTDRLNKATFCVGEKMIIYFHTTGVPDPSPVDLNKFVGEISNPGSQFPPSQNAVFLQNAKTYLISTDGVTNYYRMEADPAILNNGNGSTYAIRVDYNYITAARTGQPAGDNVVAITEVRKVKNADIVIYNSLNAYDLTQNAGTTLCSSAGVTFTLSSSQAGVFYQLYRDGVATGLPKVGPANCPQGSCSLIWSGITLPGSYIVKAYVSSGCQKDMTTNNGTANPIVLTSSVGVPVIAAQSFCLTTDPTDPQVSNLPPTYTSSGVTNNLRWFDANGNSLLSTTYLTTGTYYAAQVNSSGCLSAAVPVSVIVKVGPFSFGSYQSSRCQGDGAVTYTATGTGSRGITYTMNQESWDAGNEIDPVTGSVTYSAGYYGITIVTATSAGCNSGASAQATIVTTAKASAAGSINGPVNVALNASNVTYTVPAQCC